MSKLNYLNVGCGNKCHADWINMDMYSGNPDVIAHNLLEGLPFKDNSIDVLYHSQVLEHFPKEKAVDFIRECYRVLKQGGIIRIGVPDLENIVNEYTRLLHENLKSTDPVSEANYEWILIEMYDQTVRDESGGQMAKILQQPVVVNERFIFERIGFEGTKIRDGYLSENKTAVKISVSDKAIGFIKRILRNLKLGALRQRILNLLMKEDEKKYLSLGQFRLGGEIHYWMYDRFSLKQLLQKCGFAQVEKKAYDESNIPDWNKFGLDKTSDAGGADNCLLMEAIKPLSTH